ncbi:MAG: tRNA 2-selenouridine(34) synthase MnmH [Bdellovibrio sp.]|nr:tRNA 2-selenouridine(34) synthase MnmH [Bdellovibrio sp.]
MKTVTIGDFKAELLKGTPIIDVRAAIEFKMGSIPGSINIPVLNDQERHDVGTCFKVKGQAAAIELGHQLVSGENLEQKRNAWKLELAKNPNTIITCFRGGLRSQSTQKFLQDVGVETTRLAKGYKSARQFFIDHLQTFSNETPMLILSGTTGSGKTHVINQIKDVYPTVDLEGFAHHRGSAFGAWSIPQPAQVDFENRLSLATMKIAASLNRPLLVEDESRLIGSCHVPEYFFLKMREAPLVLIDEPVAVRVENIFEDYISSLINKESSAEQATALFAKYKNSVLKIQKKMGGLRAQELLLDLGAAENDFTQNQGFEKNKVWIEKLLVWYYDSMYLSSLEQRRPNILFKGTRQQVTAFLQAKSEL